LQSGSYFCHLSSSSIDVHCLSPGALDLLSCFFVQFLR
jgi:hypothetical protein